MAKNKKREEAQQESQIDNIETLTEEQQLEILQKYDPESNTRNVKGIFKILVFAGLLSFSLFQLYTSIGTPFTAYIQRSIHLGFALALIFLLFPAIKKPGVKKDKVPFYDVILSLLAIAVGLYWPLFYDDLVFRVGRVSDMDLFIGIVAILSDFGGCKTCSRPADHDYLDSFLGLCIFRPVFPRFPGAPWPRPEKPCTASVLYD